MGKYGDAEKVDLLKKEKEINQNYIITNVSNLFQ